MSGKITEDIAWLGAMTDELKRCTKCETERPATLQYFGKHGSGLRPDCKQCRSQHNARRYQENRDAILTRNRAWAAAHRDKVNARMKRWREQNPERHKENKKRARVRNPGINTVYQRRWVETHREHVRAYDRAYRPVARRKMDDAAKTKRKLLRKKHHILRRTGGVLTVADIQRQYERQEQKCYWCSQHLNDQYEIDHVIPVSRGGQNDLGNIVAACMSCNRRKSDRLPYTEWQPPCPLTGA